MGCSFINDFVDPDFNKRIEMRIEKGFEKGFKEGMKKKEIEIIGNLFNKGFSVEEIYDMINIPIERINKL